MVVGLHHKNKYLGDRCTYLSPRFDGKSRGSSQILTITSREKTPGHVTVTEEVMVHSIVQSKCLQLEQPLSLCSDPFEPFLSEDSP